MNIQRRTYVVSGVCCAAEESLLRKSLDAALGSGRYTFSLLSSELRVDPALSDRDIVQAVRHAGFSCRNSQTPPPSRSLFPRDVHTLTTSVAAVCAVGGILVEMLSGPELLWRALLLCAIGAGGWHVALRARAALANRTLDMNVLMTIAVTGAVLIGHWSEGAVVVVLFSVALLLESYSAARTRRAVRSLMDLSPQQTSVLRGGTEQNVPAADVQPGEIFVVRPGDRIALDGDVVEGYSAVDQSPLTGESLPAEKQPGSTVYAGSLNGRGALMVRATHRFEETTLARVIQLVENAEHKRAPVQRFIDRFAALYTPAVLGAAVVVAVLPPVLFQEAWMEWIYRALVLLVIACPCALVISTPVTLVSALTRGARRGVLIKGGKDLEVLSRVRAVAFDKTGTLTDGRAGVTDILTLDHQMPDELLRIVAAIEHRSEHALAESVLAEARRRGVTYDPSVLERFEALPGRGVMAVLGDVTYLLGNRALCREHRFCTAELLETLTRLEQQGKTTVVLGVPGKALGVIAFQDRVRPQSRLVLQGLKRLGIRQTVLLSGDHEVAVARIAAEVGADAWESGLLPHEKVERVEHLRNRYGSIAMVGDGINDAPALAAASVGIAMGGAGSDAALESADVVLMADSIEQLPTTIAMSRRAMQIIRQNIAIALVLKLLFFGLTLTGAATIWMAVLADDGASLVVIANGLRMLRFGGKED